MHPVTDTAVHLITAWFVSITNLESSLISGVDWVSTPNKVLISLIVTLDSSASSSVAGLATTTLDKLETRIVLARVASSATTLLSNTEPPPSIIFLTCNAGWPCLLKLIDDPYRS